NAGLLVLLAWARVRGAGHRGGARRYFICQLFIGQSLQPSRPACRPRQAGLIENKAAQATRTPNYANTTRSEALMQVLKELFSSDAGLMSAAGIAFMLGM